MELSEYALALITAVAAVLAAFLGFTPALDAARNLLVARDQLRKDVLLLLPPSDVRAFDASVSAVQDDATAYARREYFLEHTVDLPTLKKNSGAYDAPLLEVLRTLIAERQVTMWIEQEYEITPDFVISDQENEVIRALRPRFSSGIP